MNILTMSPYVVQVVACEVLHLLMHHTDEATGLELPPIPVFVESCHPAGAMAPCGHVNVFTPPPFVEGLN